MTSAVGAAAPSALSQVNTEDDPADLFDLVCLVGTGSFGHVWKGVLRSNGDTVALKIVPAVDKDTFFKLMQEIQMLSLCASPYITAFHGAHMKGNDLWISMEYCNVGSLASVMSRSGQALAEDVIKAVLQQLVQGLAYLHARRLIHRDVKAENILLTSTGDAKFADLGVAHQLQADWDTCKVVAGTPYWMAPELISGEDYGTPVDIWSLGITIIELADKRPPLFEFLPLQALFLISKPEHVPAFAEPAAFSPELVGFLDKCVQRNVSKRPTAAQLAAHPLLAHVDQEALVKYASDSLRANTRRNTDSSDTTSSSMHPTWNNEAHLSIDMRTLESELPSEFFPLCEACFWIPERNPWAEEFIGPFEQPAAPADSGTSDAVHAVAVSGNARPRSGEQFSSRPKSGGKSGDHVRARFGGLSLSGPITVESLFNLMRSPDKGVQLGSRYHRFRRFKDAFVGAEAVTWIMKQCGLTSREAAVTTAQELLRRQFIQNVVDQSTLFSDSKVAFYRFNAAFAVAAPATEATDPADTTVPALTQSLLGQNSLVKLRIRKIENVGFLGRTYADCFLGSDVTDLIVSELGLEDRSRGVEVARALLVSGHLVPVLPSRIVDFHINALYRLRNRY